MSIVYIFFLSFALASCGANGTSGGASSGGTQAQEQARTQFATSCGGGTCHGSFNATIRNISSATTFGNYQAAVLTVGAMAGQTWTQQQVELAISAIE